MGKLTEGGNPAEEELGKTGLLDGAQCWGIIQTMQSDKKASDS